MSLRRLWFTIAVACMTFSVRLFAAAPTLGQHGAANSSGSTTTLSPTGLTNGSAMIVGVAQVNSDTDQSYTVADTNSNTYTSAILSSNTGGTNSLRKCQIFYAMNITSTAGATTITVTSANGTVQSRSQYVEVLGASTTAPLAQTDSTAESADATSHTASAGMTTAADIFVYTIMAGDGTLGTLTETSGFTSLGADFSVSSAKSQYYSNATGLTANTLAWGSSTARTAASCAAAFVATASALTGSLGSLTGAGR